MRRTLLYVWIFALVAGLALPVGGSASAAEMPVFRVAASAESIAPGGKVTVKVSASGLPETSAYELRLKVQPAAGGQTAGLTLQSERNLLQRNGFSAKTRSGDAVTFAYALQGGQQAVTGDADLASFTFSGTGTGQARITLTAVQLLDADLAATTYESGASVQVSVSDGTATPTPTPTGSPTPTPTGSPAPTPTGSPTPTPLAGRGSSASPSVIRLTAAAPDADGTAVAAVPADRFAQALAEAPGGTVRIAVDPGASAASVAVDLPLAELRGAGGPARIEIDAGLATIAFDPARLLSLAGEEASNLRVSMRRVDVATLPAAASASIGDQPVYDFALTADERPIGPFGDGWPVTVSLPYTPDPGESEASIVAYFVEEDGRREIVKRTAYDSATGRVSFKPRHLSLYAVGEAPSLTFADLDRVPWAQSGIEALAARGIVSGVGADRFAPDRPVTRAEFVAMLTGALDARDGTSIGVFTDVKADAWYAGAVSAAAELGIARGRPDGSFGIRDEISRQDMAVMMERALRLAGVRTGDDDEATPTGNPSAFAFADSDAIAPYARDAVDALHAAGILTGVGGDRIAPAKPATRAQAAVMLYRLYRLL
ncbi:S-layer homology domain-containing protein [Cohnella sp. JJ-181]|uniref:S-layer homology domain-containing protein n=1 Tax=Cohnella rhizoplanae TaxID=2974897 RepID=UPI0022FF9335|nr:S-layer homology domain-containing protein [Cohnella sp. JJ-181]CAI6082069.1 hypothetical protein COHCIP112018_03519 [Cohnella sp. JJ-181]